MVFDSIGLKIDTPIVSLERSIKETKAGRLYEHSNLYRYMGISTDGAQCIQSAVK